MNRCYAGLAAIAAFIGLTSYASAQGPVQPSSTLIYLAKGAPHSCGPDCDTWIVFNGEINRGDSTRFVSLMQKLGDRKLPLVINSPGGSGSDALVIGRLLREKGMRAIVGRTMPTNCAPTDLRACNPATSPDTFTEARITNQLTICASACVWLILGAVEREVPPSARIGIHSGKVLFTARGIVDPSKSPDPGTRRAGEETMRQVLAIRDRYFRELGIGLELAKAADEVPHEDIKVLSRVELFRFGIDPREVLNSPWTYEASRAGTFVSTTIARRGWGGGEDFSTLLLRLSCAPGQPAELTYTARGDANAWPTGDVVVRFGNIVARLARRSDAGTAEDRSVSLARNDFVRVASTERISIAEDISGSSRMETAVSSVGFPEAAGRLLAACGAE